MTDYRERVLAANRTPSDGKSEAPREKVSQADQRRAAADRRRALQPLRNAVKAAEKKMEAGQAEIVRIDAALAEPGLFERDLDKATGLSQRRARAEEAVAEAETAWLEASEAYEQAEAESLAAE